jgi:hypothetical protein
MIAWLDIHEKHPGVIFLVTIDESQATTITQWRKTKWTDTRLCGAPCTPQTDGSWMVKDGGTMLFFRPEKAITILTTTKRKPPSSKRWTTRWRDRWEKLTKKGWVEC